MLATYFVLGLLGMLAISLVWWVIAGEIGERRKARAAAAFAMRSRHSASR